MGYISLGSLHVMGMISAILIYGKRGEILSSRVYKDGLRRAVTDVFRAQVISNPSSTPTPLLTLGSTSFLHIRHNGLFVVAVTRHDVDGIAVLEFLYKLCEVVTAQLGSFDEAACFRYVSQIYAILDELVDFGYPQNTEPGTMELPKVLSDSQSSSGNSAPNSNNGVVGSLRRSLTIGGGSSGGSSSNGASSSNNASSTSTLPRISDSDESVSLFGHKSGSNRQASTKSGSEDVPWRRSNIKHRRNEVFLDVFEKLNAVFDANGQVLSASTDGVLKVKAALSGLPHCQVDLERSEVLESSQLHACVDHKKFHTTGVVQFIPPEGEFELLRYRVSKGIKVPLQISTSYSQGEQVIRLRNKLSDKHFMNVVVLVPLPPNATSSTQKAKSSGGKARFSPEKTAVEWKIGRVSPNTELSLRIRTDQRLDNLGPVMVQFGIDMYTCTRLKVSSLVVVESSKYSTLKWVRYLTESGAVELRM